MPINKHLTLDTWFNSYTLEKQLLTSALKVFIKGIFKNNITVHNV